jgi:hypothetical protein
LAARAWLLASPILRRKRGTALTAIPARAVFGSDECAVRNVEQFGYLANQVILVHIDLEIGMSDPPHMFYQLTFLLCAELFVDQLDEWMIRGRSLVWLGGMGQ